MEICNKKIINNKGEIMKAGCVVVQNDRVLLVSDAIRSVWTFPKGHLEQGETVEMAAIREKQQETGYIEKSNKTLPRQIIRV